MFYLQRFGILEGFFFLWMCFFPHTNHFPFRLTSLSITLMLKFHWHPIQNWPKKQKSADYFPDLLLLKRIVLHLSMAFCLTGYVCQLPFVSTRKKNKKKTRPEKEEKSLALPDAQLPLRRDKRKKSQRVQGSKIISSYFTILLTCMADVYRQELQILSKAKSPVASRFSGSLENS